MGLLYAFDYSMYPYISSECLVFTDSIDAMLENIRDESEISPSLNEIVKMLVDPYRAATIAEDAARQSSDSFEDEELISPWQDGHAGEDDNDGEDVFNHVDPNEDQEGNYSGGGYDGGIDDDFGLDPMPEPNRDDDDEEASPIFSLCMIH